MLQSLSCFESAAGKKFSVRSISQGLDTSVDWIYPLEREREREREKVFNRDFPTLLVFRRSFSTKTTSAFEWKEAPSERRRTVTYLFPFDAQVSKISFVLSMAIGSS